MFTFCGKFFFFVLMVIVLLVDISTTMEKSTVELEKETLADCLMELKMSELLRLQRSLERIPELEYVETIQSREANMSLNEASVCDAAKPTTNNGTCVKPQALALTAEKRGYDYHPWQPEEKPSKLQTLFHISITALAFLSFGGYLLCLIVQAIKSKGTTYIHPDAATLLGKGDGGIRRIKIYRRARREAERKQADALSEIYKNPYMGYYY